MILNFLTKISNTNRKKTMQINSGEKVIQDFFVASCLCIYLANKTISRFCKFKKFKILEN